MAHPSKPQPQQYPTFWTYFWARRAWKRSHGGSIITTLAIAAFFGAWTGSVALMFLLIAFAIVCTAVARSRP